MTAPRSEPPADRAIVVDSLVKTFGETKALDGVSVDIKSGELFGFIGPDGAGKTTLFRILVTLLVPDSGSANGLGRDVVDDLWVLRRRIGYMPGKFSLYPDLSVEENIRFFASVFGTTLAREYEQIAPLYPQLEQIKARRAAALSGGMKQKLALCCALVHRPEILFLDEPTTGVDAVSRREFWDLLARIKSNLTIVVSTPYMDEADRCDRVALMQRGKILAVDAPSAITKSFDRPLLAVRTPERFRTLQLLRKYENTAAIYPFGEVMHFTDRRADASAGQIARELSAYLGSNGVHGVTAEATEPTIEDTFIARMGAPEGEGQRGAA
jgi:ABC-2 type transport system ATP-binding protein